MDKEKLKEQARVAMAKARAAMSEIKDNFKADEGATGARKIQSRFVNLWKSGTPGRVTLIATPVAVLLLLVLVFAGGGSGSGVQSPVPSDKSVAQSPVPAEKPPAAPGGSEGKNSASHAVAQSPVPAEKPPAAPADTEMSREERERNQIKEILALAKKSAEEDFNINFGGFFVGMSRYDAQDLAAYYKLKDDEYSVEAAPGKAVSQIWFSLKGVRRITRGGSTIEELAQAVANRVGDLKRDYDSREWGHKTIDGIVVTFGGKGLTIRNVRVASNTPLATLEAARKDKADTDAIEKRATEEMARADRAVKATTILTDMVAIPGTNYKMGKTEVTQAQWVAVMGNNPSRFKGADNPVENVSWDDCKAFLKKLNALPTVRESGLVFRLPTPKEWKYACLAGSTDYYCKLADGTEITTRTVGEVAWYNDNGGSKTHPVGQKKPNAFGLYDMLGNVEELCDGGSYCACLGHSWNNAGGCPGVRGDGDPYYGSDSCLGFRLLATQK